jgi:hypothetical protein
MAGKYVRLKNDFQQYQVAVQRQMESLSRRIEVVIGGETPRQNPSGEVLNEKMSRP